MDAISPQDADYDIDKSSAYLMAPAKMVYEAAGVAGYGNKATIDQVIMADFNVNINNNRAMQQWGGLQKHYAWLEAVL